MDKEKYLRQLYISLMFLAGIFAIVITVLTMPIMVGKTIVLDTMPVDPFDPFRGQYMRINYEINEIPSMQKSNKGSSIYVSLEPDSEGVWRYVSASHEKPSSGTFIKGKVKYNYQPNMRIEYGIEQYFFERHADLPTRNITIEVKVDKFGNSRIIQMLQNNEPIDIEYEKPSLFN